MARSNESPGTRLRALWERLAPIPGGAWIFSRIMGRMVPYSGSIGATVRAFSPGHALIELPDRRAVRNHLKSIHAIALANLGELCSGLALIGGLPPDARAILVGIEVRFTKKARGRLRAESRCDVPAVSESIDYPVTAEIRDASGDVVAVVTAHWRLGPMRKDAA